LGDGWAGQVTVCLVHFYGEPIVVGVFSNPNYADESDAELGCNQVANYDQSGIVWYPA
jgi:hypothetical protein